MSRGPAQRIDQCRSMSTMHGNGDSENVAHVKAKDVERKVSLLVSAVDASNKKMTGTIVL